MGKITKIEIENYVKENIHNYSKESIEKQLINSGANVDDVNLVFKQVYNSIPSNNIKTNKRPKFILILLIFILFLIPFFLILAIISTSLFVNNVSIVSNKIDITNNLHGDVVNSLYDSKTKKFNLLFRYNGARLVEINSTKIELVDLKGNFCKVISFKNLDTGTENELILFLNGQKGLVQFSCPNYENKEVFEAKVKIDVTDPKTQLDIPSTGNIRLEII